MENREDFQTALAEAILNDSDTASLYELAFNYLMIDYDGRTDKELKEVAVDYAPYLIEEYFTLEENEND